MRPESSPQNHRQADVQGRRLIEGLIESPQQLEQPAEKTVRFGALVSQEQWESEEAAYRYHLRRDQSLDMHIQLPTGGANQKRHTIQQVAGPVRDDGPGEERHRLFPPEYDRRNIGAPAGHVIRKAVAQEEKRTQCRDP